MRTRPIAYILVLISTLISTFGQVMWKMGSQSLGLEISSIFLNIPIYMGFILNGVAYIFLVFAFKHGQMSTLYPLTALNFIWVAIISNVMLGESMNLPGWSGIILIVFGVIAIGNSEVKRGSVHHA